MEGDGERWERRLREVEEEMEGSGREGEGGGRERGVEGLGKRTERAKEGN